MRIYHSAQGRNAIDVARRLERPVRLTTGLILFAFATSHLINHAFGIRSVDAMQAASAVLLAPWQTSAGLIVLYTAFFAHGLLGFYALYRRRHLRMPANEAWQLALGLTIPFLLISHPAGIRLGEFQYGRELATAPQSGWQPICRSPASQAQPAAIADRREQGSHLCASRSIGSGEQSRTLDDTDFAGRATAAAALIVSLAAHHKLPALYFASFVVRDGGLISYGPDSV